MDSVLTESPMASRSFAVGPFAGANLQSMLKESIDRFLVEVQKEACDFSAFRSVFSRLLQSSVDPPLEVVWFYCAVGYHEAVRSKRDVLDRVLAIRDLLQLFAAFSVSCGGAKSIAMLAPAISELYCCLKEEEKLSGKARKKVRSEIQSLVEGVVSFVGICSGKASSAHQSSSGFLLPCFGDLVRVWTVQHSAGEDCLRALFPLAGNDASDNLREQECSIGYLAGVVVAEAFLLRLASHVQLSGAPRSELQKELKIWAVSSITAFQNSVFFDLLLKMLLNPPLPIISLVNASDEILVRDVLFDAVILVDYSFMNLDESTTTTVIRRLIVTHEAAQHAKEHGNLGKATSYLNAFSTSFLSSDLIKWVKNRVGSKKVHMPNPTTPQDLLKWLMCLEQQGLKLLEDNLYQICTRLKFEESNIASKNSNFILDSKGDSNASFFFDNKGSISENTAEDEVMEQMDTAFLSAARSMNSEASNGRKRKESGSKASESQMKFTKYKVHDSSVKGYLSAPATDTTSSSSEVEDPPSDDEMEEA